MMDFVTEMGLCIINTEKKPQTFSGPMGSSCIDLTVCTPDVLVLIKKWSVDFNTASDHATISFQISACEYPRSLDRVFVPKNVDWELFKEEIKQRASGVIKVEYPANVSEIDESVESIRKVITDAANATFKASKPIMRPKPWWNKDLDEARKARNRSRKDFHKCKDPAMRKAKETLYKIIRNKFVRKIQREKRASWKKFIEDSTEKGPWGIAYSSIRGNMYARSSLPAIQGMGNYPDNIESASYNMLREILGEDNFAQDTPEDKRLREQVRIPSGQDMGEDWDKLDVELAIKSLNSKGAPGGDGISVKTVSVVFQVIGDEIVNLMNCCLGTGFFPTMWKRAAVVILNKKGPRDLAVANSYRPICLLPVMGKVLEKLIKKEISSYVIPKISTSQFGGIKGRSTEQAVRTLIREAGQGQEKYAIAISIDIAGAYDSAWWPRVLKEIQLLELPSNLFGLMCSYLEGRSAYLRDTGGEDAIFEVSRGCPQGSILGPSLWLVLIDGLLVLIEQLGHRAIAFVDDIIIIIKASSRQKVQDAANMAMRQVAEWIKDARMVIAKNKTCGLLLRGKVDDRHPLRIFVEDSRIAFPEVVTYLGVSFGQGLSVQPHIDRILGKSNSVLNIFNKMAGALWGMSFKPSVQLYKACCISIVMYAVAAWGGLLTRNNMKSLLKVQRILLLRIIRGYRTISYEAANVIAGIPPIDLLIKARIAQVYKIKNWDFPTKTSQSLIAKLDIPREDPKFKYKVKQAAWEWVLDAWEAEWTASSKAAMTKKFFPTIMDRVDKEWITTDYFITQYLSGHGDFASYLHKYKKKDSPLCCCGEEDEDAEHALRRCMLYNAPRVKLMHQCCDYGLDLARLVETTENYKHFKEFLSKIVGTKKKMTK